jgi:hypothetical protein
VIPTSAELIARVLVERRLPATWANIRAIARELRGET